MCSIFIKQVYCGPPKSGNGGYVAGALAQHLQGDVEVKLLAPPPVETELKVCKQEAEAKLFYGEECVAEAKQMQFPKMDIPKAPTFEEALEAAKRSPTYNLSFDNTCFVCSANREVGQGLRIFPGALNRDMMVAAPWYPYAQLADANGLIKEEFVWAALDCPGAFTAYAYLKTPFLLLGKQLTHINERLPVNQNYIACGWHVKQDGRKHFTNTVLFSESGKVLAYTQQIWIELKQ